MCVGEIVAELAETQREIHDQDVPQEREDEAQLEQQEIHERDAQHPGQQTTSQASTPCFFLPASKPCATVSAWN